MASLILVRHGESEWNQANLFTGWVDVDLSDKGILEAELAGELIKREENLDLSVVYTSLLKRAIKTAQIVLEKADLAYLPVFRHWRLNERHYGALQGLDKKEVAEEYGQEQLKAWRRGYLTPPPPLEITSPMHPRNDPRYKDVFPAALPSSECLADVVKRMLPYFEDQIAPSLLAGKDVLVVAHGNSLRALVKTLEGISDDDIADLDIPTGVPRLYGFDESLGIKEARYLGDQDEIERRAEAVKKQAG